jgi:hypothetical protein
MVLKLMYRGTVDVPKDELDEFAKTAQFIKLRCLQVRAMEIPDFERKYRAHLKKAARERRDYLVPEGVHGHGHGHKRERGGHNKESRREREERHHDGSDLANLREYRHHGRFKKRRLEDGRRPEGDGGSVLGRTEVDGSSSLAEPFDEGGDVGGSQGHHGEDEAGPGSRVERCFSGDGDLSIATVPELVKSEAPQLSNFELEELQKTIRVSYTVRRLLDFESYSTCDPIDDGWVPKKMAKIVKTSW